MKIIRFCLVMGMLFALSACGFKPVHAPSAFGGNGLVFSDIAIETPGNEKIDFLLKQALRDRFGDNKTAPLILHVTPKTRRINLGIGADDVASRYDLVMDAGFILIDAKTGDEVYKDKVRVVSTFGAPRDPYGTATAQSNAEGQVANETADRIIAKLALYQPRAGAQ